MCGIRLFQITSQNKNSDIKSSRHYGKNKQNNSNCGKDRYRLFGLSADIAGVATAADTFSELRENVKEAINLYVETADEFKEEIPEILKGDYVVELNIQPFMNKAISF
jgi:predicted RNase H-like HicB family nuclease